MLIESVSVTFGSGALTALIGRNGAGKSTLLRAMAGLNDRYTGQILLCGEDLASLSPAARARRLALVTTGRTRIPGMRCSEVVAAGRAPYTGLAGRLSDADRALADEALRTVGMEDYASRTMDTMSDGECQRIMIGRALAQDTPVMLLDEPTSFLDMPARYELATMLRDLAHTRNRCVVFSTHELDIALRMCDSVALVADHTIYNLPARDMASSGLIARMFGSGFGNLGFEM